MKQEQGGEGHADGPGAESAEPVRTEGRLAVRPIVPLGSAERSLLAAASALTVYAVAGLLTGSVTMHGMFLREVPPRLPVHRPLPDLCGVFAGGSAAGLGVSAELSSRALDRNDARCDYTAEGGAHRPEASLLLHAGRPELSLHENAGAELREARRDFRSDVTDPLSGTAGYRAVQGLGDEAKIASRSGDGSTEVGCVVRRGVLTVSVRYSVSADGENTKVAQPREAEQVVQRVAAELLKQIPPD